MRSASPTGRARPNTVLGSANLLYRTAQFRLNNMLNSDAVARSWPMRRREIISLLGGAAVPGRSRRERRRPVMPLVGFMNILSP